MAAVDNFPSNSYLNSPVANDTLVDFGVGDSWASVEGLLNSGDRGSITDSCNGGSLSNSVASRGSSDSSIASRAGSSISSFLNPSFVLLAGGLQWLVLRSRQTQQTTGGGLILYTVIGLVVLLLLSTADECSYTFNVATARSAID